MNQIIGIVDAYAWPSIAGAVLANRVLMPRLFAREPDEAAIAGALPQARLCLSEIGRLMGDNRYLAADFVTLADLMAVPLLYYFANTPDGEGPTAEHPKLQQWLRLMESRQSFQVTKPPPI
jgi:glutathione S-transferase